MKELKVNYEQAKELRKAIALAIREIDCIEEEERFEILSGLYDDVAEVEEDLEESEED